jgi:hypothetical protein
VAGEPDVGVPRRLDAGDAVGARSRWRGEALGDLELHHDEDPPQAREELEEAQHHGDRDVVGQVGDERGGRGPWERGDGHGVGVHDLEAVRETRRVGGDRLRQRRREHGVDLDGDHPVDGGKQGEGERPQARSHLDDGVSRSDPGDPHDASHGVAVDDEVLAPLLGRPDAVPGRQSSDLGGPQQRGLGAGGHGLTLTTAGCNS